MKCAHRWIVLGDSKETVCRFCWDQPGMAGVQDFSSYLTQVYSNSNMSTYMNQQSRFLTNLTSGTSSQNIYLNAPASPYYYTTNPRYNTTITNLGDAQLIDS